MDALVQMKNKLEKLVNQAQQWIHQMPPTRLYASIGVFSLTTVYIFRLSAPEGLQTDMAKIGFGVGSSLQVRSHKHKLSNTIVLAGLSGSGKTVLFHQLQDGCSHQETITSMDPNEGTFVVHSGIIKKGKLKRLDLVDVPGHSRLRPKLDEYLPHAAGLVFVVDALEFLPNCRAVAEFLYDILTKASIVKRKIPVLVLCNKTDKVTAHTKKFIQKQLEREIDKLRASRIAISAADIANEYTFGVTGETFAFSQCLNKVTIAEASALTGKIFEVEQFISENIKP